VRGPPWRIEADGLLIDIRLMPRGGRDAIDGVAQLADGRGVLKVCVRAAASEGEANAALVRFIATMLGVAPRDVTLLAGASARLRAGAKLAAALEKICATG
jgi:uncharacterized protein YggU (UPF0235/DUF167 family)